MLFVIKQKWSGKKLINLILSVQRGIWLKNLKTLRIQNSLLVGSIALIPSINLFASRLVNFWQTPLSSDACQYWCSLVALRVGKVLFYHFIDHTASRVAATRSQLSTAFLPREEFIFFTRRKWIFLTSFIIPLVKFKFTYIWKTPFPSLSPNYIVVLFELWEWQDCFNAVLNNSINHIQVRPIRSHCCPMSVRYWQQDIVIPYLCCYPSNISSTFSTEQ